MNPLRPEMMSAAERLTEIGELLAAALIRLRARAETENSHRDVECPLDFGGIRSGHAVQFAEARE